MTCDLCQSRAAFASYGGQYICGECFNGISPTPDPTPDADGDVECEPLTGPEYLRWYLERRITDMAIKLEVATNLNPFSLHASALENDLEVVMRLYLDALDDCGITDLTDAVSGDPVTELGANLLYWRSLLARRNFA